LRNAASSFGISSEVRTNVNTSKTLSTFFGGGHSGPLPSARWLRLVWIRLGRFVPRSQYHANCE
jgi:hypothetical protein